MHVVGHIDGEGKGKVGTTTTPVDGNKIICSGHVIGKEFDDPQATLTNVIEPIMIDGDFHEQYEGYQKLKWSHDPTESIDAALLSGADTQYQFATDKGATTGDIVGTVTKTKLETIEDSGTENNETLTFQGARTGLNDSDFGIERNKDITIETDIHTEEGDSGGPVYTHWEDYYPEKFALPDGLSADYVPVNQDLIAGVHVGKLKDNPHASSMHAIESEFKIEV